MPSIIGVSEHSLSAKTIIQTLLKYLDIWESVGAGSSKGKPVGRGGTQELGVGPPRTTDAVKSGWKEAVWNTAASADPSLNLASFAIWGGTGNGPRQEKLLRGFGGAWENLHTPLKAFANRKAMENRMAGGCVATASRISAHWDLGFDSSNTR